MPRFIKRLGRKVLIELLYVLARLKSRPLKLDSVGSITVVAPHQDDEALGCGGLIAHARARGIPVSVVYVTDGSASHGPLDPSDLLHLSEQRKTEARKAMALLGVQGSELHFLGVKDGTLDKLNEGQKQAIVDSVTTILESSKTPSALFLPCLKDASSEHDACTMLFAKSSLGIQPGKHPVLHYPIWSIWNPLTGIANILSPLQLFRLDYADYREIKKEALSHYVSQTTPDPESGHTVLGEQFVASFLKRHEYFFGP